MCYTSLMSEHDLLADCLKDVTKERDDLAVALEQTEKEAACAAHNAAEYHEIIRSQRERIEQLETVLEAARPFADTATCFEKDCIHKICVLNRALETAGASGS